MTAHTNRLGQFPILDSAVDRSAASYLLHIAWQDHSDSGVNIAGLSSLWRWRRSSSSCPLISLWGRLSRIEQYQDRLPCDHNVIFAISCGIPQAWIHILVENIAQCVPLDSNGAHDDEKSNHQFITSCPGHHFRFNLH